MLSLKKVVGILFMAIAVIIVANGDLIVNNEDVFNNCMNIAR